MSITRGNFEKDMMGRFDFSLIPSNDGDGPYGWVSQYAHQETREAARAWIAGMKRGQQLQPQPEKDQSAAVKALHDLAFSIRYTPQGLPALHALRQADVVLAAYANQPAPVASGVQDEVADIPASFVEYVAREIPPGTVISNPEWWTPRLWRAACAGLPTQKPSVPIVTDEMVSRFLGWKLPKEFHSDGGVKRDDAYLAAFPMHWPTGTNLLHAGQAREMLQYVLSALPVDKIIRDTDFSIHTFRKAGGFVASPDVGVRILHVPTGLTAERSDAHSQHKNRSDAMAYLRSRLIEQGWKDPAYEPNPHNYIIKDASD